MDKQQRYCLLICHKSEEEKALEQLRPFGFSATAFQGLTGTAKENLDRLAGEIAENRKQQEAATAAIVQEAGAGTPCGSMPTDWLPRLPRIPMPSGC